MLSLSLYIYVIHLTYFSSLKFDFSKMRKIYFSRISITRQFSIFK